MSNIVDNKTFNTVDGLDMNIKLVGYNYWSSHSFTVYGSQGSNHNPEFDKFWDLKITKRMFNSVEYSMVVSPEFLSFAAQAGSLTVAVFAGKHVNTPVEALTFIIEKEKYTTSHSLAVYMALENPHTPIRDVVIGWHRIMPKSHLNYSPAFTDRKEEFLQMLAEYGLTISDLDKIPAEWVIKTLFEGSV